MRILKIAFFLLLFLFPFGQIARFEFSNGFVVMINDIVVGLTVCIWLAWKYMFNKRRFDISTLSLTKPIGIFLIICVLSLVVNWKNLELTEFVISFMYLARFAAYAGLYFVVRSFDAKFGQKIPYLLSISGCVFLVIGYIQYLLYPSLRNLYYLGWDEHLYRMFSSFLDPNFAGAFFGLYALLGGAFCVFYMQKKDWKKLTVVFIILLLAIIAIFLTYSRGAILMFFVSTSVFLLLLKKRRWIGGFIILAALFIFLSQNMLKSEGTNIFRIASSVARFQYIHNAIVIFKDNPVLGIGFNAYRYAQFRYGFVDEVTSGESHAGAGTDNSFLFVLATTGVIGFASYLYMWFKILKQSWHFGTISKKNLVLNSPNDLLPFLIIASAIGLFVNALFINSLFYPFIMEWMWILIGLTREQE